MTNIGVWISVLPYVGYRKGRWDYITHMCKPWSPSSQGLQTLGMQTLEPFKPGPANLGHVNLGALLPCIPCQGLQTLLPCCPYQGLQILELLQGPANLRNYSQNKFVEWGANIITLRQLNISQNSSSLKTWVCQKYSVWQLCTQSQVYDYSHSPCMASEMASHQDQNDSGRNLSWWQLIITCTMYACSSHITPSVKLLLRVSLSTDSEKFRNALIKDSDKWIRTEYTARLKKCHNE